MSRMNAQIDITAKNKTQKAFDSVNRNLSSLRKSASKTIANTAKIGAAFAAAGAGAAAAMVKMRMQAIDSLAKTADKLGVTTEALAGFRHAAELSGVSTQQFDKALQNMGVQIANAAKGTGLAKRALDDLNLNAIALTKLPLDQQMLEVAKAMESVESHSERTRIAYELFGARGVGVLNMMKNGAEAMDAMAKEAETLGIALNRVDAAQIEAANDNVTRAKGVFEGFANQITVALSPAISELAANFYQTALDTQEAGSVGDRVAKLMVRGFGFVADGVLGLKLLIKGIQLVFARLSEGLLRGFSQIGKAADAVIEQYNKIARFFGRPTLAANVSRNFEMMADSFKTVGDDIQAEITNALNEPLPSTRVNEWFDNVQMKARETAEVVAANAPAVVAAQAAENLPAPTVENDPVTQARLEGEEALTQFKKKSAMEQTQIVLGGLDQQLSGIAKHNKAAFRLQQGVQIAQAVMNTYTGATKALASFPPPINFAMAAAVVASGLAQVAQIRSQSFEGGGFTGMGARAGGLDGKGGFPAILHPNESVIDHTKGGGERVIVQQTINVTTGIQQTVRAEIANMLPVITDAAKAAVADSRMRGGGYSRAMGG